MLTFQMYQDKHGDWRWRLRAKNGRTIADSGEGYQHRADCLNAIKLVQNESTRAAIRDRPA